jgi:hypothetical protein
MTLEKESQQCWLSIKITITYSESATAAAQMITPNPILLTKSAKL